MNVLGAGGDRQRRALARDFAVADARADEGAAAIEVENRGVAKIFDQFDGCWNSIRSDPDGAGADTHDHLALAAFPQRRRQAMPGDLYAAIPVASGYKVHRRPADKSRDVDRVRLRKNLGGAAYLLDFAGHEHRH